MASAGSAPSSAPRPCAWAGCWPASPRTIPETLGLLALIEIQASRLHARTGPDGEPVLLLDQDRTRWDQLLIRRGLANIERIQELGGTAGPYALQAAIAACHARARVAADTDWARIASLYDGLSQISPSPVVELNRGVAAAQAFGPEAGLDIVRPLFELDSMRSYHLLPGSGRRPVLPRRRPRPGQAALPARRLAHQERRRAVDDAAASGRVRRARSDVRLVAVELLAQVVVLLAQVAGLSLQPEDLLDPGEVEALAQQGGDAVDPGDVDRAVAAGAALGASRPDQPLGLVGPQRRRGDAGELRRDGDAVDGLPVAGRTARRPTTAGSRRPPDEGRAETRPRRRRTLVSTLGRVRDSPLTLWPQSDQISTS